MAEAKTVRGALAGVTVVTSKETAEALGSAFEPEKATAKKAAAKSEK